MKALLWAVQTAGVIGVICLFVPGVVSAEAVSTSLMCVAQRSVYADQSFAVSSSQSVYFNCELEPELCNLPSEPQAGSFETIQTTQHSPEKQTIIAQVLPSTLRDLRPSPTPSPTLKPSIPTPTPEQQEESPSPTSSTNPSPLPTPPLAAPTSGGLDAEVLFAMTNAHRASIGKPAYQKDDKLCALARERAPELQEEIYGAKYIHQGFVERNLPYWITENAISQQTEQAAFNWWMNSSLHRRGLESSMTYACPACSGKNCLMLFTSWQPK
ncbi:MAG: hypothetical protein H6774_02980 [Pseudomonadales bacterium]|nr:hypothetical protein [Candidatus Woesebacteria bacterium]MCB9802029.1 hypothetical protein [Pseudomonadales bacterium]